MKKILEFESILGKIIPIMLLYIFYLKLCYTIGLRELFILSSSTFVCTSARSELYFRIMQCSLFTSVVHPIVFTLAGDRTVKDSFLA